MKRLPWRLEAVGPPRWAADAAVTEAARPWKLQLSLLMGAVLVLVFVLAAAAMSDDVLRKIGRGGKERQE